MFDRIVKWAKVISSKPNYKCDFFYIHSNGRLMIIDAHRLSNAPEILLNKIRSKKRAYIFVETSDNVKVKYFAFNQDENENFTEETEGYLDFDVMIDCVLSFLEKNINFICEFEEPFAKFTEMNSSNAIRNNSSNQEQYGRRYDSHTSSSTNYQTTSTAITKYDFSYIRERDKFLDNIYYFIKLGRSAEIIDYIYDFINLKVKSNEKTDQDLLLYLFKSISFDKLNFIISRELIRATSKLDPQPEDRNQFIYKYNNILKCSHGNNNKIMEKFGVS